MENREEIIQLLERYRLRECSREEIVRLLSLIKSSDDEEFRDIFLSEEAHEEIINRADVSQEKLERMDALFQQIEAKRKAPRTIRFWSKIIPVAAALLALGAVGFYMWRNTQPTTQPLTSTYKDDVDPGGNRATLTIAGQSYQLQESQQLLVNKGDTIAYGNGDPVTLADSVRWVTLSTPRAGQYRVVLNDGTKVWLNAASQLRYPTRFEGNERQVELDGEAYFEVSRNTQQPFTVKSRGQRLTVLGTAFNINAYSNEELVATTLVNGSIQLNVENSDISRMLKPGEQALFADNHFDVTQVDTQVYTGWKDGFIVLNQSDVHTIIRQIERWYDVDFQFADPLPPGATLNGKLLRSAKLSGILNALEVSTGMHFTIEKERRIMARKN